MVNRGRALGVLVGTYRVGWHLECTANLDLLFTQD